MKRLVAGILIGVMLSTTCYAVEFGWTDSSKLERVAKACEDMASTLRDIREELKHR